jgi:hypothetical protein
VEQSDRLIALGDGVVTYDGVPADADVAALTEPSPEAPPDTTVEAAVEADIDPSTEVG